MRGTVTAISAPAGTGKTTVLAAWAADSRWPGATAWLTLDEYDDQPDLFWQYLVAALQRAGIPALDDFDDGPADWPRLAAALAGNRQPAILVLDNLHVLHDPRLTAGFRYVLAHSGTGLRVIASSRTDPPLPLHQYLLTGDLTEIGTGQLAFTVPEAKLLLAKHDVAMSGEALAWLVRKTEGWAAGLRITALDLREHLQGAYRKPGSPDDPITVYLTGEVLDAQPQHVRDFLLRTSVPDTINPALANELTGAEHSGLALSALVRAKLFIEPTGDGWYRYHHLFAEVLRARLEHDSPGEIASLQRRAADWFRRHGRLADAVGCAMRADDWQLAADLTVNELAVSQLLDPDCRQALAEMLRPVPRDAEWQQPQPYLVSAAIMVGEQDDEAAAALLDRAEHILKQISPDHEVPSRLAAALIRFQLAQHTGCLSAMDEAAQEASVQFGQLPAEVRARHPEVRIHVLSCRGAATLWLGSIEDAEEILAAAAVPLIETAASAEVLAGEQARSIGYLALAGALRGRLGHARSLAAMALDGREPDSREPDGPCVEGHEPDGHELNGHELDGEAAPTDHSGEAAPTAAANIALAWVQLERNELVQARGSLKRTDADLRRRRDRAAASVASLVAARLFLAEGRLAAASNMLVRARQGWSPPDWLEHRLIMTEAQCLTMAGDTLAALDAAARCGRYSAFDAATAKAAALVAAGDLQSARQALEQAAEHAADDAGNDLPVIGNLLIGARIHHENGNYETSHRSLSRALRIAQGEVIRLPFVTERTWLLPALRADIELMRGYQLLFPPARAGRGRDARCLPTVEPDTVAVIEPLTEREQEVLKRVAQLLSTDEIASDLFISVNTVKTHLKSVNRKLAVTDRRGAVRRAWQLKLL